MTNGQHRPLLIYIAGPISNSDKEVERENVRRATRAAVELMHAGHNVVCPHWDWYAQQDDWGYDFSERTAVHYATMLRNDIAVLMRCDALLLLDRSPGVDLERFVAETLRGMPVFRTVDEIPTPAQLGEAEAL